jgi:Raf kinase inhibitor-like YbhB/YbcL family protein
MKEEVWRTVPTERARLRVASPGFAGGAPLPQRYTADGMDISPAIMWGDPPRGTASFALICDDPDAIDGTFVHWLVWNIKSGTRELDEDIPRNDLVSGVRQGRNSAGSRGYFGPAPPPGKLHHYRFRVFALDVRPDLPSGATSRELDRAMRGHILAEGEVTGTYAR